MRLIVLFIIIFLHGCNPQKMEKLGKKEIVQSRKIIANKDGSKQRLKKLKNIL